MKLKLFYPPQFQKKSKKQILKIQKTKTQIMKTSINFKPVKFDSEAHNFRKKNFDYLRKDLTPKNEYWIEQKIADRLQKIETYCKEKSGRKLQKNAMPIREAVVVIKEDTTMLELHHLSKRLEEELKIRIFQIAIHKDEGHYDKDTKEWKPNYHAHLVADWQDLATGKTLKHQSFHYSKMQDLAAECLEMERGKSDNSLYRLEAIDFKIQKKEEYLRELEIKQQQFESDLTNKTLEELIVMKDFLGFKKLDAEKTIENLKKQIKVQKLQLASEKQTKEKQSKQLTELAEEIKNLKKEILSLKNKNTKMLSDSDYLASEKKKYTDLIQQTYEKAIMYSRHRYSHLNFEDKKQIQDELIKIGQKISEENKIPTSAFKEIFSDSKKVARLYNLLSFGNPNGQRIEKIISKKEQAPIQLSAKNKEMENEPERKRGLKR